MDGYLMKETRPWGSFRVYLFNDRFEPKWARQFVRKLAQEHPQVQKGNRLRSHMESILRKVGTDASTTVKVISVNPLSRLSLQYHSRRSEEWFCLRGDAVATLGSDLRRHTLGVGGNVSIPIGMQHRLESTSGSEVLEVATGTFDENDVVRLADDFSRVGEYVPGQPVGIAIR